MSFDQLPEAATSQEFADFSRVPVAAVEKEAEAGRLPAYRIGDEWRIVKSKLLMGGGGGSALPTSGRPTGGTPENGDDDGIRIGEFRRVDDFEYVWPDRTPESYHDVYDADATVNGRVVRVRIGSTEREVAGLENRLKVTVFLNDVAMSEFAGANDVESSGLVAGIIKPDGDSQRHLRVTEPIPQRYRRFRVAPYNQVVQGKHAASGLAVIADRNDLGTLGHHALIRWASKQEARAEL
jgi:hypothetical protein